MLDTMPYVDLLAIYNAIAEKPVARFDTRVNGVRRTEALLDARGLTVAETARLANVVLPSADTSEGAPPADGAVQQPADNVDLVPSPDNDSETDQRGVAVDHGAEPIEPGPSTTILVDPTIAQSVEAFVRELMKPARPVYIAAFLRRLDAGGATPGSTTTKRDGGMTPSQRKIVDLCNRPEGATGKELAEGCGWPSIAARATCQKLADRFGYDLHESPKANGRGISFRMAAKIAAEEQA